MKVRKAEEDMDRARTPAELVAAIDKAKAAKVPASAIQQAEQRLAEKMKARDAVNTVARCRLGAVRSMGWDGAGWDGAHAAARVFC